MPAFRRCGRRQGGAARLHQCHHRLSGTRRADRKVAQEPDESPWPGHPFGGVPCRLRREELAPLPELLLGHTPAPLQSRRDPARARALHQRSAGSHVRAKEQPHQADGRRRCGAVQARPRAPREALRVRPLRGTLRGGQRSGDRDALLQRDAAPFERPRHVLEKSLRAPRVLRVPCLVQSALDAGAGALRQVSEHVSALVQRDTAG